MLVEARDVEDSEEDPPARKAPRSPLRVRSGLDEEYSSDEIEKMTLLYEGTLSNIEEGEIVKSKVLRVTDTAVILDVGFKSEGAVPLDEFKASSSRSSSSTNGVATSSCRAGCCSRPSARRNATC